MTVALRPWLVSCESKVVRQHDVQSRSECRAFGRAVGRGRPDAPGAVHFHTFELEELPEGTTHWRLRVVFAEPGLEDRVEASDISAIVMSGRVL